MATARPASTGRLSSEDLMSRVVQAKASERFDPSVSGGSTVDIGGGYSADFTQPGRYVGEGEFVQTGEPQLTMISRDLGNNYAEIYTPQGQYVETRYIPPSNDFAIIASMLAAPFLAEFILPAISSALPAGTSAATASAVANAAAKAGIAIATGADPGKALVGAVASAGLSGVNLGGALDNIITDPQVSDAIASAAKSMASTAAGGGTADDIVRAGLSGAAGSALASQSGNIQVGRLVGQVLAGESPAQIMGSTLGGAAQTAIKDIKGDTKPTNIPRTVAGTPVTPSAPTGPAAEPMTPEQQILAQTGAQPAAPEAASPQEAIQAAVLMDNFTKAYTVPVEALENFKNWADQYVQYGGNPNDLKAFTQFVYEGQVPAEMSAQLEKVDVGGQRGTAADIQVGGAPTEKGGAAQLPSVEVRGGEQPAEQAPKRDTELEPVTVVGEKEKRDTELDPVTITAPRMGQGDGFEFERVEILPTEPEAPAEPPKVITVTTPAKPPKPSRPAGGEPAPTDIQRGGSPLQQALTAFVPAGEVEVGTGKPRQNVWNEASLRLKDALGL